MTYRPNNTLPDAVDRLVAHEARWRRFGVHRASRHARVAVIGTGWPALDRLLPGGGYPLGAVTELLCAAAGIGELSLLLGCLQQRLVAYPQRRIALVSPPHTLVAPALTAAGIDRARLPVIRCPGDAERVWCIEQMARSNTFAAFVLWSETLDTTALRRLQLAAEQALCPVFVYRGLQHAHQRSPAALRLAVTRTGDGQRLEVLKCRGPAGMRLDGLRPGRDTPWRAPAAESISVGTPACNETDHVACPAFSPLGAR